MSLTRDRGLIIFECDNCHDTFETETKSFQEALALLKAEPGWFMRKLGNDWYHFHDNKCYREFMKKKYEE